MIRTQIQLPPLQYEKLRQNAVTTDKSIAQQIREAIDLYFQHVERPKTKSIRDIAGKFRPLSPEKLKLHDQWFAESILKSKHLPVKSSK